MSGGKWTYERSGRNDYGVARVLWSVFDSDGRWIADFVREADARTAVEAVNARACAEPVAYQWRSKTPNGFWAHCSEREARDADESMEVRPLYTHPTPAPADVAWRVHDCALAAYLMGTATAAEEHARFETKLARDLRDERARSAALTEAEAHADDEAAYAKALQVALTGLTNGGSEYFVRHGDGFRADIKACVEYVQKSRTGTQQLAKDALRRARTAEAEIERLRAALFMCAAHCQGGHSDAGVAAAERLGVPFPIRMAALVTAAEAEGRDPRKLWPWLYTMPFLTPPEPEGERT